MLSRIERLRARMREYDLPALLISKGEDIYYLSGFSGCMNEVSRFDGMMIVTLDRQLFISDFRYQLQAQAQIPACEFVLAERSLTLTTRSVLHDLGATRVGMHPAHLTVTQFRELGGTYYRAPYRLVAVPPLVEGLRAVKDAEEIALIRRAAELTDAACLHVMEQARPGITERELATAAEIFLLRHGADGLAFEIIVAAGANSALPHATAGTRVLQSGDLVVVDLGAKYQHYCADLTRTFAVGEPPPEARAIYRICLQAQLAGLAGMHAGLTGQEADRLVRMVIEDTGYGAYFGHGTGHGVGLEAHEAPRVSRTGADPLPVNAVVTVEPGIYLPGVGGVRIEDLVVVTEDGVDILSRAPKPAELPIRG